METDIDSYRASDDALRETASAQGDLLHPGERFGGFSIVSFLGRGATSEVWRVKDDALHAKGVVHRDIKPANVLLDNYGNAILTDFGIVQIDDGEPAAQVARPDTSTATAIGADTARIAGTPDFSAPEQFMGADATPASDLHAVGRLAIWLFDGKPPLFWRWFVMRATNSSSALRYTSVKAMKRALAAARLSWLVSCALAAVIPVAIAALLFFHEEPPPIRLDTDDDVGEIKTEWILPEMETPSSNVRTCVITLEGGRSYKIGLLSGWQFYRELKNGKRGGPYRHGPHHP